MELFKVETVGFFVKRDYSIKIIVNYYCTLLKFMNSFLILCDNVKKCVLCVLYKY